LESGVARRLAKGCGVEVLRIVNSVDWTTTTIPPSSRRSPDRLGRGHPFPRSTGKVLAVATESRKKFQRGPGSEKRPSFLDKENRQSNGRSGGGRGGCKLRGRAGRFQSGVMVVQKAMGLALSGAEKTSGIALRRRTRIYAGDALNMAIEQASRIMDAIESKARGSSDPGNGVGRPGARRASISQD
jgi:hypothetical protein